MQHGQSAMEILITYGWMILVIVVAVAVLFYLGIFNPKVNTAVCMITPPFSCIDSIVTSQSGVSLRIGSSDIVQTANVTEISLTGKNCTIAGSLKPGIESVVTGSGECSGLDKGLSYSGSFSIFYVGRTGLNHTVSGIFSGTIEA